MKFTAITIATSIACASAFLPSTKISQVSEAEYILSLFGGFRIYLRWSNFILLSQGCTELNGHALGGYDPSKYAPKSEPVSFASGIPGFSGFGHATGASPAPAAPAPSPASYSSTGIPGFSGFGHATGSMGGNPSIAFSSYVKPAVPAPAPVPPKPVFSGFGHFNGQMGGNPAIPKANPIAAKKPAATSGSYLGSL
jgi:hypothetical protein